jgi:hypothetical protein
MIYQIDVDKSIASPAIDAIPTGSCYTRLLNERVYPRL